MPNGGFNAYAQRTTTKKFAHPNPEPRTLTVTLGSALVKMVLKAGTWLQRTDTGVVVPHSGLARSQWFTFGGVNPAVAADTLVLTIGSSVFTFTVGSGKTLTAAEAAQAVATGSSSKGSWSPAYVPPTLADYTVEVSPTNPALVVFAWKDFDSIATNTLTLTTTSATLTVATGGVIADNPVSVTNSMGNREAIAGILLYDVVSPAGVPTQAQAYVSGSFWAEDWVRWRTAATETVTDADGVVHTCTAYETGCNSDLAYQAFVSGTEFNIVTQLDGEKEI
jgi:hypothetical protein